MFNRSQFKDLAKQQIQGKIGILFLCSLVIWAILTVVSFLISSIMPSPLTSVLQSVLADPEMIFEHPEYLIPMLTPSILSEIVKGILQSLVAVGFTMSTVMIYLGVTHGRTPQVQDIFKGFSIWGKALWLHVLMVFFTLAWSLLFLIPGMVKSLAYSMAPRILAENPGMTARQALRESQRITNGYKLDLWVLALSFLGWILLVVPTFGLIMIYLTPYMETTSAHAYHFLKQQAQPQEDAREPVYQETEG